MHNANIFAGNYWMNPPQFMGHLLPLPPQQEEQKTAPHFLQRKNLFPLAVVALQDVQWAAIA